MASNIKVLPEKNMQGAPENRDMPLPLLDLSDAACAPMCDDNARAVNGQGCFDSCL